jgi:HAD superfamily hydrolase (TIGR01509 family)
VITTVLFDWDGTLVDSKAAIQASYREATTEVLGRPYPSTEEEWVIVRPMRAQESFGMMSDDPAVVERLIERYGVAYRKNSEALGQAFPGTREVLEGLRARGLKTGVVTSKARSRMESDARSFGLEGLFDVLVTGDESAERKPHPGPIIDALQILGIEGSEVVYVGDGPQDVLAARGAGTLAVSCSYGLHGPEECLAENPDHMIHDIRELTSVVDLLLAPAPAAAAD